MHLLRRLGRNRQGIALIEFAIVLPVFMLLFIGSVETARYLLFREKLESSATQMLNIINQSSNVNKASLDNLYAAFPDLIKPYVSDDVQIITTQIVNPASGETNCQAVASWQYPEGGSRIAPKVGGPVDTRTISLLGGDNIVAIEVFATYKPLVDSSVTRSILGQNPLIYAYTYEHARYGQFSLDPVTQQPAAFTGSGQPDARCVQLSRSAVAPSGN